MDPQRFPALRCNECSHTVGLYKSGRCVLCGFKVMPSWKKRFDPNWVKWVLISMRVMTYKGGV